MPFINTNISKKLNDSEKTMLKTELGKAISLFPGKSENWLMCAIEDGCEMYFQGEKGECAFGEVKLFGSVDKSSADKFTAAYCEIMSKLGIPSGRVYVRYEGGSDWGWNGANF